MTENLQPDWRYAPEWAKFWAIDSDGGACWYEVEPQYDIEDECWSISEEFVGRQAPAPDPDWSQTLRRRP
jgi:hypothetical protein